MKKHLLLTEFARTPWALSPDYLDVFTAVVLRWSSNEPMSAEVSEEISAAQAARTARRNSAASVGGGIAVLPLYGVITQRASMVDDISGGGGTSTQRFSQSFRQAMADDSVGGIIIDIDSPGGSVFGVQDLCDEIYQARGVKPVFAYVNSQCASAAYWIASACQSIYSIQGGLTGSIGVFMAHDNLADAMKMKGISREYVSSGKFKIEGNPTGPLSDEARAFMQSLSDSYYSAFTGAVSKGRGKPISAVRDGMGQARSLLAQDALSEGMIDGICTFDDAVAKMSKSMRQGAGAKAEVVQPEMQASAEVAEVESEPVQNNFSSRAAARMRALEIASV